MFSECVNGLLRRLQRDSDVNVDDAGNDITPSKIPVGIIPTGTGLFCKMISPFKQSTNFRFLSVILISKSTRYYNVDIYSNIYVFLGSGNYLANYIHGTKDIETATLKIIIGECFAVLFIFTRSVHFVNSSSSNILSSYLPGF